MASELGKRTSFNGALGKSDIEGKAAMGSGENGAAGDACDIDGQTERSKWVGAHESKLGSERVSNKAGAHESMQTTSEWSRGDARDIAGQTDRSICAGAHESISIR